MPLGPVTHPAFRGYLVEEREMHVKSSVWVALQYSEIAVPGAGPAPRLRALEEVLVPPSAGRQEGVDRPQTLVEALLHDSKVIAEGVDRTLQE